MRLLSDAERERRAEKAEAKRKRRREHVVACLEGKIKRDVQSELDHLQDALKKAHAVVRMLEKERIENLRDQR
jgi:hypothetical protein